MIATRIRDAEYKDINSLEEDLILMCRNAQSFNEPGSQIYKVTHLAQCCMSVAFRFKHSHDHVGRGKINRIPTLQ